jgi:hypothetical protein
MSRGIFRRVAKVVRGYFKTCCKESNRENVLDEAHPSRTVSSEINPNPMAPSKDDEGNPPQSVKKEVPGKPIINPSRPTQFWIQGLIWQLEESHGPRLLKIAGCLLGFVLLALWFNFHSNHGFSNPDAMESAHLGRRLAAWDGYTTYSIRPSTLGLLQRADPGRAQDVLRHPVPDLSIAPGYPLVLACLMKVFPFDFAANPNPLRLYQPEVVITEFNTTLFFAAILLLFQLARRLFDSEVAWVSAIIFAGSETYWKFSASGLSTMWLVLVFLALSWCLMALEERERREIPPAPGWSLALAAATGALVGLGGLSRYAFGWMIIPVLLFIGVFFKRDRGRIFLLAAVSFLLVMAPWIARNLALSHTPFGTAGYALLENTRALEEDRVERSLDPFAAGLSHLTPGDVINKFVINEANVLKNDLPRLGGNWVWPFFLCGLLLPLRSEGLRRMRYFLVGSLALMAVVQPLGQTHLSLESPETNSENLLVLLAPLALIFGTAFFLTLLEQMVFPDPRIRSGVAIFFAVVMYVPLLLDLAGPQDKAPNSPYAPFHIQSTAAMMHPDELMMSDIPWAVAWYGERPCAWLTLNDAGSFDELDKLQPIHAVYLTQRTTDRRFLSQILDNQHSWERFMYDGLAKSDWPQGSVPANFPLTKAPLDYMPAQLFISDAIRWRSGPKK